MIVQGALNGGRGRDWHQRVPRSPADLAADAVAAARAGAACLHVHPRDAAGAESLLPADVDAALAAIRAAAPGIPVGISTGAWIAPFGAARIAGLAALSERPDYVSVNLSEADAPAVIAAACALGIGVEAGLAAVADVDRLAGLPEARRCLRLLVEINEQDEAEALAAFAAVTRRIADLVLPAPVLAHGFEAGFWPVLRAAAARGLDLRAGLEDGRLGPDGAVVDGNADLVAAAIRVGHSLRNA